MLKRLSQARADGDLIYAVIRGSAVNQDGRSNGITAPNGSAQEAVIRAAWREAGLSPAEAQYIEAHGAGTLLGDVIEANALKNALAANGSLDQPCAIGSVKTNIGHCEAAAGVAGLIKVALAIRHGEIPASLHFDEPNPGIPFEEMPFFVQNQRASWPDQGPRRLAGVSSFGFGGTNAHVVLESAPQLTSHQSTGAGDGALEDAASGGPTERLSLFPLSAAEPAALIELAGRFRDTLADETPDFASLCQAAATRRTHLQHRAAILAHDNDALAERLKFLVESKIHSDVITGQVAPDAESRVVFVFSGQGGQWHGMHRAFHECFPDFRETIQECDSLIRQHAGWSLLDELGADRSASHGTSEEVERIQTSLFAFQVALANAWKSWGILPDAVIGHSMGEVAAAHVAGALGLSDAVRVIVHRSRILQQALVEIPDVGGMAALRVSHEEAEELIQGYEDRVTIAVLNSPKYTVLAGSEDVLSDLIDRLKTRRVGARRMNVPGAAHTPKLAPMGAVLRSILLDLHPQEETIPFYSTLAGRRIDGICLDASYWGDSVCKPVCFAPAIDQLIAEEGFRMFVELGPHPILASAVSQCAQYRRQKVFSLPSQRRDDQQLHAMLQTAATLYANGHEVPWDRVYPNPVSTRVSLPTYPWQRQRCWLEAESEAATTSASEVPSGNGVSRDHPLLGRPIDVAVDPTLHCWNAVLSVQQLPYLSQYQMNDDIVVPLAACLEAIVSAAGQTLARAAHIIDRVIFERPLAFSSDTVESVQMVLETNGSDESTFRCFSRQADASWKLHTSGRIRPVGSNGVDVRLSNQIKAAYALPVDIRDSRRSPSDAADNSALRCLRGFRFGDQRSFAQATLPNELASDAPGYAMHPILLDACFAVMAAACEGKVPDAESRYVPMSVEQIYWHANPRPESTLSVYALVDPHVDSGSDSVQGDLFVWEDDRRPILEVSGLQLLRVVAGRREPRSSAKVADTASLKTCLDALRSSNDQNREERLQEYVRAHIAYTLQMHPTEINVHDSVISLGIDSLMASEIRNRISTELKFRIEIAQFLLSPTIAQLAETFIDEVSQSVSPSQAVDTTFGPESEDGAVDTFEETGEDQIELDPDVAQDLLEDLEGGTLTEDQMNELLGRLTEENEVDEGDEEDEEDEGDEADEEERGDTS